MKKFYLTRIFILLAGNVVAWISVYDDFLRFYGMEGTIFKLENCTYPNPVVTPCFYGAIGFFGALIFAVYLFKKEKSDIKIRMEKYLSAFLFGGTLFGWWNFSKLYVAYFHGSQIGCSGAPMINPFSTPCFYGSVLFLVSLASSLLILWKEKNAQL